MSQLHFWKHKTSGTVIDQDSFNQLPYAHTLTYETTEDQPTHEIQDDDNDDGFSLIALASMVTSDESLDDNSGSDNNSGSDYPSPDSISFDGGSGGGGGAEESY